MGSQGTLDFQSGDPKLSTSNTGDPTSFAYPTARSRWPKIFDQAIEDIESAVSRNGALSETDVSAAKEIQSKISTLKESIASNAKLEPLQDDGGSDVKDYNNELRTLDRPSWRNGPWLYMECFMYRLMHTFFTTSTPFWQTFDMFSASKREALVGSKKGAIELVTYFLGMIEALGSKDTVDEMTQKAVFEEMLQISLWGNATDLSLLTSVSVEELDSRQGKAARESSKANVLVDDTDQVWKRLSKLKSEKIIGEIHCVLDNAGFELLTDLVLVSYLLESGFAKKIVLHGKRMPWFVSDVNPTDLTDLIDGFANGTTYTDISEEDKHQLQAAGKHWQNLMHSGKLSFSSHPFWTTQHSYGRMAIVEPELYQQLVGADLVIYKGDLNYRKLTYDCMWPKITPFKEAIGPLATKQIEGKGTRTLALRTAKADVGVGLEAGMEEKLPADWTRTGKYALVSYWDAKS